MKRLFVEAENFRSIIDEIAENGLMEEILIQILRNPKVGDLIRGSGGIRKFRIGLKGKGKSGGLRVFYLDIPAKEKCYLLFILKKSERENINSSERDELRNMVKKLKG